MAQQINLQKIVSVKGKPGLYFLRSFNPKGYHLQPFNEGRLIFVSNEKSRVLALGNIDLKLKEGSINLLDAFKTLSENEESLRLIKDVDSLFSHIFPDLDREVIHETHLNRIIKWFQLIQIEFKMSEMVNEEDDGLTVV